MKEFFIPALCAAILISLFAMAAFLIYRSADGWGWFLFAVVCVVGSTKRGIYK